MATTTTTTTTEGDRPVDDRPEDDRPEDDRLEDDRLEDDRPEGDRLDGGNETAETVSPSVLDDPQTHTDFTGNLDACVAQGTRDDMDATDSGQAAVERVWIMSRPPGLGRGARPTVTARRAYVVLRHVQGQTVDPGGPACETVCRPAADGAAVADRDPPGRPSGACGGYTECD